jgi:hypothetical protein
LSERAGLFDSAIHIIDWVLRWRHGVNAYTADKSCLLRVERVRAHAKICLADGTTVLPGDPLLILHLWNERLPRMEAVGATLQWAQRTTLGLEASLTGLAEVLRYHPDYERVRAVQAEIRFVSERKQRQLVRLAAAFGFEEAQPDWLRRSGRMSEAMKNFYAVMLTFAFNPRALKSSAPTNACTVLLASRRSLELRFGTNLMPLDVVAKDIFSSAAARKRLPSAARPRMPMGSRIADDVRV